MMIAPSNMKARLTTNVRRLFWFILLLLFTVPVLASEWKTLELTNTVIGYIAVAVFILAYIFVVLEEYLGLRKSVPVMVAAGVIWVLVSILARQRGNTAEFVDTALHHNLEEYGSLFFFLLVAMTYINVITERNLFSALRAWLLAKHFNYKQVFWTTGILTFVISPIADNLTTSLVMGAVVFAIGSHNSKFSSMATINIVVAANAGGAFSPFGDLTTLMIWESGKVSTFQFGALFIPALINFLVPALIMHTMLPNGTPETAHEPVHIKQGGIVICVLFGLTIITAIIFDQIFYLRPYMGMMTGFTYLLLYAYFMDKTSNNFERDSSANIFAQLAHAEWDTLLFFFGIMFCIGGLAHIGYLELISNSLYSGLGPTVTNIAVGLLSAILDNIPVMFGILKMDPDMSTFQWLLVTLTAGVGGSILSIGSAAGVALMGMSKGQYTFMNHLRWSWAIMLGYAASIYTHFLLNAN
jgi:Na+/H+ antiporter NhaD/arsenite permease-like protein